MFMVELNFNPGDYVKLRLAMDEKEGQVLESPDSKVVLIKLSSGYNIGIPKENILGCRVIKKFKAEEKEEGEIEVSEKGQKEKKKESNGKGKKSIGMIVTGGTIASKLDPRTGGVKHITSLDEFRKFYPEVFEKVNVKQIEVPFMVASESMNSEHWKEIAKVAEKMLNDKEIEGIIITHGTDFLSYTGAALSFFLRNLNKPVVLTYSQRSIDRASSDANLNLRCAVNFVLSDCAEVVLVGHASSNDDYCYAIRGTKARKMHSSKRDAFKAINDLPIAKVWGDKIEFLQSYRKRNGNKVELDIAYSDKVGLIKFYPGQDSSILDYYALKYKGVVIEGSGLGHIPVSESSNSWISAIKRHVKNGFVICMTTQCLNGRVDGYVYSNGRELIDAGVIFLEDMLPETALVKLGWILGHYGQKKNVSEKMLENFAGELNSRLKL